MSPSLITWTIALFFAGSAFAACPIPNQTYSVEIPQELHEKGWIASYFYSAGEDKNPEIANLYLRSGQYYLEIKGDFVLGLAEKHFDASEYFMRALAQIPPNTSFTLVTSMTGGVDSTSEPIIHALQNKCGFDQSLCRIKTYIPKKGFCGSACVFPFLIGQERRAAPDAKFYFHAAADVFSGEMLPNEMPETLNRLADYTNLVSPKTPLTREWIERERTKSLASIEGAKYSALDLMQTNSGLLTSIDTDEVFESLMTELGFSEMTSVKRYSLTKMLVCK
jgi:hypothetical protein